MQRLVFFTIVARNYLAYAYVLGASVKRYHPDADFAIFLMDDVSGEYAAEVRAQSFLALGPDQIELPDYPQFVFKYNVTEASTGVKPFVMQHLLSQGAAKLIYLDPDILCFRRFDEVLTALDTSSIVLTPHSTSPLDPDTFPDDQLFLAAGVYNLGFIAVRDDQNTRQFLAWWSARLLGNCLDQLESNLFVDQKWIDLVPAYFADVCILKSPAYNIAYWNLHERRVVQRNETLYVEPSDEAVAFIHFSGMVVDSSEQISKYGPRSPLTLVKQRYSFHDRPDLLAPFQHYGQLVRAAGIDRYAAIPYAYNSYANGEAISQLERSIFGAAPNHQAAHRDPFATTPHSFWRACRRAGIRSAPLRSGKASRDEIPRKYRLAFIVIQWLLRLMMRVLGPDMYASFAKYMRQQLLLTNQDFLLKK